MSRIDFGSKAYLTPMPVLIIGTYDAQGVPNAMNAAWGMISDFGEVSISLGRHKTTENFAITGAFTVSMGTEDTVPACDYVGIVSGGSEPDKVRKAGLTPEASRFVNAPLFRELPLGLECRVKRFEDGILVGEIVNVSAEETVLTDGKIDPEKLHPIAYDPLSNRYYALGRQVANAFVEGAKLK